MSGNISMKTTKIKKFSMFPSNKFNTEAVTQAKDYGKLE